MEFALEESFVPVWEILTSAWKMRSAISRIVLAAFVKGRDFSDVILLEGRKWKQGGSLNTGPENDLI